MLNPFPSLLVFGFFAPTLLRIAAALCFLFIASRFIQKRDAAHEVTLYFGIRLRPLWCIVSSVIMIIVAAGLLFGFEVQWAALVGAIIALKLVVYAGRFRALSLPSRGTYVLLMIICLSLLATGAGAFAFDVPL